MGSKDSMDVVKILAQLEKEALTQSMPIVGSERGAFLAEQVAKHSPKNILEIGTLIGYSAITMANRMPADSQITTIEKDLRFIEMARANIAKAGFEKQITVWAGNALDLIPAIEKEIDFVFLDAGKGEYLQYLKLAEPKLAEKAIIVADNARRFKYEMHDFLEYLDSNSKYSCQIFDFSTDSIAVACYRR